MPAGTAILRQWILVLHNGMIVVDWGNGQYQDLDNGKFIDVVDSDISHTAQNLELEMLKRASRVNDYDAVKVWLMVMPERPGHAID